jgi:predicted fused transcriptional regulator/phosphomethylpyrimidine kinase/predicted transcriptional regulator
MLIKQLADRGCTQQKIAESLSLTQAAVSNYLKKELDVKDDDLKLIEPLVEQSVAAFLKDTTKLDVIMGAVCRTCKQERGPGGRLCAIHCDEIPLLQDEHCSICSMYLDKSMLQMDSERRLIYDELLAAYDRIRNNKAYVALIPEVQSNLVMGLMAPDKNDIDDYAGFPGRIIKYDDTEARIAGYPSFGASKHIARIVASIRANIPSIRSATCIVYNQKIKGALVQAGFSCISLDNENNLDALNQAMEDQEMNILDTVVFKGSVGLEPLTYIVGTSASDVIDKLEKLIRLI